MQRYIGPLVLSRRLGRPPSSDIRLPLKSSYFRSKRPCGAFGPRDSSTGVPGSRNPASNTPLEVPFRHAEGAPRKAHSPRGRLEPANLVSPNRVVVTHLG